MQKTFHEHTDSGVVAPGQDKDTVPTTEANYCTSWEDPDGGNKKGLQTVQPLNSQGMLNLPLPRSGFRNCDPLAG